MEVHATSQETGYRSSFAIAHKGLIRVRRRRNLAELAAGSPAVSTREGRLTIAAILADVGLDVSIVWDQTLLPGELSDDAWPGEGNLRDLADRYRTLSPPEGVWHLHLVLGRRSAAAREISQASDPRCRRSGIVFVDPDPEASGSALHAVVHEIGHLLNLPHPWDAYGNTRSAMTYPWRWEGWDWRDPTVYHFDAVGRRHILRDPVWFVRPGCYQPAEH